MRKEQTKTMKIEGKETSLKLVMDMVGVLKRLLLSLSGSSYGVKAAGKDGRR